MSGIEVVGVVLGVLPLAAKAVDGYLKYTSNIRKYDNDLRELLQDFVVEDTRLRNSCRNLLNDIIPFDNIESGHGTNPFSPKLSSTVRNKLKLKLYDSYPMFEQTMENIKTVASDLKLKLNLQEDGTAALKDKHSVVRLLKAKTGFTLRKKDYEATISRLKAANAFLETLARAGTEQQISNKRRSNYRVITLLRKLVKSLFSALQNAVTDCRCPVSHNACLELVARDLVFIHTIDTEEVVAKDINFHVTLSSGGSDPDQGQLQTRPRWTGFRLHCGGPDAPPSPAQAPSIPCRFTTASPCTQDKFQASTQLGALSPAAGSTTELFKSKLPGSNKRQKTVSFAPDLPNATHAMALLAVSVSGLKVAAPGFPFPENPERQSADTDLGRVFKICELSIYNKGKKRALGRDDVCHGCIMDAAGPRTFRLYPPRWRLAGQLQSPPGNSDLTTSFTLRQILDRDMDLQGPTGEIFHLDLESPLTKLRIAHAIAASVLYIYDTPWLSQVITLDSIVFFLDGDSNFQLDQIQPFVLRPIESKAEPSSHSGSDLIVSSTHGALLLGYPVPRSRPLDATPFSLGLILIQLMLGYVDDRLDLANMCSPTKTSRENVLTFPIVQDLHLHAIPLLYKLTEKCSIDFQNAVKWCLESYRGTRGFFDEAFCHAFRMKWLRYWNRSWKW